jgi:hypothetical protein
MTSYSIVLFVHITAVLALFAALAFETLSLARLRQASSIAEVRFWLDPVPRLPLAAMGSLLIALFSGIYLMVRMSAGGEAWPRVTIASMLLIGPIAGVSAARIRAIRGYAAKSGTVTPDLRRRIRDPFLKASLGVRIAVMLGIVLLMGAKPELRESVAVIAASAVLGLVSSRPTAPSGT